MITLGYYYSISFPCKFTSKSVMWDGKRRSLKQTQLKQILVCLLFRTRCLCLKCSEEYSGQKKNLNRTLRNNVCEKFLYSSSLELELLFRSICFRTEMSFSFQRIDSSLLLFQKFKFFIFFWKKTILGMILWICLFKIIFVFARPQFVTDFDFGVRERKNLRELTCFLLDRFVRKSGLWKKSERSKKHRFRNVVTTYFLKWRTVKLTIYTAHSQRGRGEREHWATNE